MRAAALGLILATLCFATLEHVYVDQRQDIEKGKAFGSAGPYERITGWAVYDKTHKVEMEYLKPREPTQGNGALILLTGKSQVHPDLMQKGYIVLRMKTSDAAAIRELVSFLRYGGGPEAFLLGDQKRFVKRAIVAGDANTLEPILLTNTNGQNKLLFDGVVVVGSKPYSAPSGIKSVQAKADLTISVVELDGQLSQSAK
ncbi:MAG TPA: hypothetical protein VEX68_24545 [Bryobacteraceae bacterium]|nr:hypothetical protein [Bryobacteraceae bacterium]